MSQVEARWLHKDANTLVADGSNLKVKLNATQLLEATTEGVGIIPDTVILPGGTVTFTGNQSMGNNLLQDLAQPTTETDAVNKVFVDSMFDQATTRSVHIEQIKPTVTHISNKYITLEYTPIITSDISVSVLNGGMQVQGLDFEIKNGNQLSWAGKGMEALLDTQDTLVITYARSVGIITGTPTYAAKTQPALPVNTFAPDSTKVGVVPFHFLNMYDSMKYSAATDGGLWVTLPITKGYIYNTDIFFDIVYAVTVKDAVAGRAVRLKFDMYEASTTATSVLAAPSVSDDIVPGALAANTLSSFSTLSIKVPGAKVNANTLAYSINLWRDTSIANNYNSEFVVIAIIPRQVV